MKTNSIISKLDNFPQMIFKSDLDFEREILKYGQSVIKDKVSDNPLNDPVFVVGCPRSGTTLLGNCLISHPNTTGSEESLFLIDMWRILSDLHHGLNSRKYKPLQDFITTDSLLKSIKTFSDSLFMKYRSQGSFFIDHTPWYACILPMILSIYPNAKIIHIIRDGRQVEESLHKFHNSGVPWAGSTIQNRVKLWTDIVHQARKSSKLLPENSYLEIKYEDLCSNKEITIMRVSKFIGLDYNKKMLDAFKKRHAAPSRKDISVATTGWPDSYSTEDKKTFLKIGGELLSTLGYI